MLEFVIPIFSLFESCVLLQACYEDQQTDINGGLQVISEERAFSELRAGNEHSLRGNYFLL